MEFAGLKWAAVLKRDSEVEITRIDFTTTICFSCVKTESGRSIHQLNTQFKPFCFQELESVIMNLSLTEIYVLN